ncbi:MAG TPA: EVE domain-containing protein [Terriglobia bacterium]|nr:EVE domain-containing protein [Terriglobia bacterium]
MNYWICKGRPDNHFDEKLVPGQKDCWWTAKRPKALAKGDRVFFWESSPKRRLVGLGQVARPECDEKEDGDFEIRYLTRRFESMPGIVELRGVPFVNQAQFLKPGPASVLTPLNSEQAVTLLTLLSLRNPQATLDAVWPDLMHSDKENLPSEAEAFGLLAREGGRKLATHFMRERNRQIVNAKRQTSLKAMGRLRCEVCEFDFEEAYGSLGQGFSEVHHKLPLSKVESEIETRLEDLAIVCSNCHRMIHRRNPPLSMEKLKNLVNKAHRTPRSISIGSHP